MRRYYPFFPMLPAIALRDVEIDGYEYQKIAGCLRYLWYNHDARTIDHPEKFDIKRYIGKTKEFLMKKNMK
ncbi:hypothetical protein [Lactiplantibacillus plantarum]|uniref:hypothetical protein n=1 Tax=Lactiplantibacillus plantarum TaxID=1590 RepID=UPI003C6CE3B6